MASNPGKIVIIVEKIAKSTLPAIQNPRYYNLNGRFLCEKDYKFSMIKNMLEKKIKDTGKVEFQGKNSFFIFIKGTLPNPGFCISYLESTMIEIYNKHKDDDGFLYLQYSDQESL